MEVVNLSYAKEDVERGDLMVELNAGIVLRSQLGSLVALRTQLRELFGDRLIWCQFSSDHIHAVKWNDLSPAKQRKMEEKRNDRRRRRNNSI